MSSEVIGLVAVATASGVVVVALLVSELVHKVVDGSSNGSELPPLELHLAEGRSTDMKQFRQSRSEQLEGPAVEEGGQQPPDEESGSYRQVGDEVAAVLTAAEHAAAQIRETALREAEQTRRAADEQAAATLAGANARQTHAAKYSDETRSAADSYAAETRRSAEEEAARRISEAEEHARRTRAAAEQTVMALEADVSQRRDVLTGRIESILVAFRGATTELEKLLAAEGLSLADQPEPRADEPLDEALEHAASSRV